MFFFRESQQKTQSSKPPVGIGISNPFKNSQKNKKKNGSINFVRFRSSGFLEMDNDDINECEKNKLNGKTNAKKCDGSHGTFSNSDKSELSKTFP